MRAHSAVRPFIYFVVQNACLELAEKIAAALANDSTCEIGWDTVTSIWPDKACHPDERLIGIHKLAAECKAHAKIEHGLRVRFLRAPRPYNAFERVEKRLRYIEMAAAREATARRKRRNAHSGP